jgi:GNAT superfamily N-acetyltransferase
MSICLVAGMTSVQVRTATESDAALLAEFRYEFRSSLGRAVESEEQFVERCTAWMRDRLRNGSSWKCWIAEHEGEPAGDAWAQLIEKIPNPVSEAEHYVYLTNIYVREQYRGRGIGSDLLAVALAWGRANNAQSAVLWPTQRSRSLYSRQGFSEAHGLVHLAFHPDAEAGLRLRESGAEAKLNIAAGSDK